MILAKVKSMSSNGMNESSIYKKMQVFVDLLNVKKIAIEVAPLDSTENLKEKIAQITGLPVSDQVLSICQNGSIVELKNSSRIYLGDLVKSKTIINLSCKPNHSSTAFYIHVVTETGRVLHVRPEGGNSTKILNLIQQLSTRLSLPAERLFLRLVNMSRYVNKGLVHVFNTLEESCVTSGAVIFVQIHPDRCNWFHGKITRDQAEQVMSSATDGQFLVKESNSFPGDYVLFVCANGKVIYYLVRCKENMMFTIDEKQFCNSIDDLVKFYQNKRGSLPVKLTEPVNKQESTHCTNGISMDGSSTNAALPRARLRTETEIKLQVMVGPKTFSLLTSPLNQIQSLKEQIKEQSGVPTDCQFLRLNDKPLVMNNFILENYRIRDNSTITVQVHPWSEEWFIGKLAQNEVESGVKGLNVANGMFLITESITSPGDYCLRVWWKGHPIPYRVECKQGRYRIEKSQQFSSLSSLVEYYRKHSGPLRTPLTEPVKFDKEQKDSSFPLEILARGSKAKYAFQKAMQTGKVKVYRGRIMFLGQDRAGKTSLKKSLLGLPFDPRQESTVGVEVDPSTCEIEVDQVINWTPCERKELEESEFGEEIARLVAKDLAQTEPDKKNETAAVSQLDQVQESSRPENLEQPSNEAESWSDMDQKMTEEVGNELELNLDTTTLPNNVADLVDRYLQDLRLEDDIKTKEVILTLWDFAGQHLYYAAHSVFLSQRAVYVLVYNLNKNLLAEAKPCCRQGIDEILLDNFNKESNLDNLLSWMVSVYSIRSVAADAHKILENEKKKLPYLRPPVIIVGTHADQPFEDVKTTEKRIKKIISEQEYGGHVIAPFFAVNNKAENDEGVQKLRQKIMEVLKNEPYMGEEVPLRWFHFEKVVEALVAKSMYHVNLDQLLPVIKQLCRIDDEDETTAMLNFYHDLGVIVKHGRTVVLQAQWLIDLFKQLITVPPFDEADPLYRKYWKELQGTGILKTALVDHVFSAFIEKGLRKQDILEMMELYGLIAKFSSGMSTSENEEEQIYFVPTQLTSSPSELCKIKPSERDPCPLFVDFLDGFVPHGLFPRFVSRCISWCSENGSTETPELFNNGACFSLGKQIMFALICRKRFFKVVLKRLPCSPSSSNASNKVAVKVRTFIERTLDGFSQDLPWLSNLRYQLSVACTHCLQSDQDDTLHLLRVLPCGELASCRKNFSHATVTVPGLEKWFELQHSQNEEQEMDKSSEAEALDPSFPYKSGTPSRDDVLLIAHELGTKWKMLGRVLDVSDPVLEQIEKDNDERSESCYQVLIRWQEKFASKATYQCLAQALQHPSVDRAALAVKYCEKKAG